jgi:excisionase family DNA binding protein
MPLFVERRIPMFTLTTNPSHQAHRQHLGARVRRGARRVTDGGSAFTPLIDAKAASKLLGVPHTWLLTQARARHIPHHRLGHYVRFDPADLRDWLQEGKITPARHARN